MAHSFREKISHLKQIAADNVARAVCTSMLIASGAAFAQSGEFTDRINSARAIDTTAMRDSAKRGADNFGAIIQVLGMVLGAIFFFWGVFWVMKANRTDGRQEAGPGYWMIIGGGVLGAGMAAYAFMVGAFAGITA